MKTVIAEIRHSAFPELTIEPGTLVVWQNRDPIAHSVETVASSPDYFNAGAMLPGEASSPILFARAGSFPYVCRFHTGMTGTVNVREGQHDHDHHGGGHTDDNGSHHHHTLAHLHGFVTGGRTGGRLYMTHTPVLADDRHNYQVILRGRFAKPEHARIYEDLRASAYGDQVVQIFHNHISMPDIGSGKITLLPNASVAHWPGGSQTAIGPTQVTIAGLDDVPIALDEVLHFHQFDTDAPYPDALTYFMYGDGEDVFIDHAIDRAPGFHTVAKLAAAPKGWSGNATRTFRVPGRAIRDLDPRLANRFAIVDNAFHVFWLAPPGQLPRQAQDPLIRRSTAPVRHIHPIEFEDGEKSEIEISRFLHFDVRLLNYGVLIV